jgi:hypothetical protein
MRARRKIGSKEAAMPTRRFKRIALAQLLLSGCAVMFGVCVLIEHAQAQPGYVPPPTPLPPPVLNPSNPGTVPQPSYRPITPTIPSTTPSTPSTVPSSEVTSPTIPRRLPVLVDQSKPEPQARRSGLFRVLALGTTAYFVAQRTPPSSHHSAKYADPLKSSS